MEEQQSNPYGAVYNEVGKMIDVSIPNDAKAEGWRYDRVSHSIIIFSPSSYTLVGTTTVNNVIVEPEEPTEEWFHLILENVDIRTNQYRISPISIREGAACRLLLNGYNYCYANSSNAAAIQVAYGASLEMDEWLPGRSGYLRAVGSNSAATIGANYSEYSFGNITIKNVSLNLDVPSQGSGIGYSYYYSDKQSSGKIKIINGNTIINNYSSYGDGICCQNIEISGGRLTARGAYRGSGIALDGPADEEAEIRISGNAEVIAYGGSYCPGIDCFKPGRNGKITIYSGVVTAYGGDGAAGIGTGYYLQGEDSTEAIVINGGMVAAYGGEGGAGIGTGIGTGVGQVIQTIQINGGLVSAFGNNGGAGIGGGRKGKVNSIMISKNANVIAESNQEGTCDVGDGCWMDAYTGLYSGIYAGELSGLYQGRLSGIFKGEIARDYMKKIECNISGVYKGKAKGKFSGLFSGRYQGYINPSYMKR